MTHWYSPRGARRGLLLAGIAALLWLSWAAGYLQGAATTPPPVVQPLTSTTTPDPSAPPAVAPASRHAPQHHV